jgi:hypothetical protein
MRIVVHRPAGRGGITLVSVLVLAVLFGGLIADENRQISRQRYGGFQTYYAAAAAIRSNQSPYTRAPGRYSYVYPPLFACFMTPMLRLPVDQAARIMMSLDTACIFGALVLIASATSMRLFGRVRVDVIAPVVASTALFLVIPIHNELKGLETNAIVLLCFAAGLFFADSVPLVAGSAMAVAIIIKYLPVSMLPYLVLRRRWWLSSSTVVATVALGLLPAVFVGWNTNLRFLSTALGGLVNLTGGGPSPADGAEVPALTQSTSLSLTSGLARFASANNWPKVAVVGCFAIMAAVIVLIAWRTYRKNRIPLLQWPAASSQRAAPYRTLFLLEWTWLIGVLLALGPNTQDRLLVLLAFPAALFFALIWSGVGRTSPWLIIGGMTLLCAVTLPISWMGFELSHAWRDAGMPGLLVLTGATLVVTATLNCIYRQHALADGFDATTAEGRAAA